MAKFIPPPPSLYFHERNPVPIVLEAGWTPEPVWTFLEKIKSLIHVGIQTPNHPASADEFVSEKSSYFQH